MPRKLKPCKGCGGSKPSGSGILYCETCSARCSIHGLVRSNPTNDCKECRAAYIRVYTSSDPERVIKNARRARAGRLGITLEELAEYEAVEACEVCGSDDTLSIDHNHDTGKIRGVLCARCNHTLGHARDNPEILRALAIYLEEH